MSRYVKLVSDNNGPFVDGTNKMVHFTIPDYGTIDFSKSRLNINTQIDNTEHMPAPFSFKKTGSDLLASNMDFIRNVKMQSSKKGMVEQVQEINVLRNTLSKHTKSAEKTGMSGDYSVYKPLSYNMKTGDIFADYERIGAVDSKFKQAPISNKMADVCPVFETNEVVNMAEMGETKLMVELDLSNLEFEVADLSATPAGKLGIANIANATGADLDVDTITTTAIYEDLTVSPYYVGQTISFDATGYAVATEHVITEIEWLATRALEITLATDITVPDGGITACVASPVAPTNFTATFISCDLSLCYVADELAEPLKPYKTFTTEKMTVPQQARLNHNFSIDPQCLSVYLCSLVTGTNKSEYDATTSWELFLNNESLTDGESVRIFSGLSKEKLMLALVNSGYKPEKLSDAEADVVGLMFEANVAKHYDVIASPVAYSPAQQQLQCRINTTDAGNAPSNLILFKQVVKSL